jgi:hypothetical protein
MDRMDQAQITFTKPHPIIMPMSGHSEAFFQRLLSAPRLIADS